MHHPKEWKELNLKKIVFVVEKYFFKINNAVGAKFDAKIIKKYFVIMVLSQKNAYFLSSSKIGVARSFFFNFYYYKYSFNLSLSPQLKA